MSNSKNRVLYWDNIKGVLMLLTVFAHILLPFQYNHHINSIFDYIYMFHMPAFIFVSGYFGKSEKAHSFEAVIKLVFLYFIFNSIMGFIYGFGSLLDPLYSYWYLLALVVWRITAHHIAGFREINLILMVIAVFAGFYDSINNTFSAARIIAFYPFYMSGYLLSEEKSVRLIKTTFIKRFGKGLLYLSAACVTAYLAYNFFEYSDDSLMMFSYINPIDSFGRIALFVIAFLAVNALRNLSPDKNIPLITMCGRNSLAIFILHRPFTLLISDMISTRNTGLIILIAAFSTLILCVLLGNNFAAKHMNRFCNNGAAIFTNKESRKLSFAKLIGTLVALGFVVSVVTEAYSGVKLSDLKNLFNEEYSEEIEDNTETDPIYTVMDSKQKSEFDNAFRITFSGDLILLEDQVKRAYTDNGYDFSPVFEYAEKYISSADFAIGVFEGPMAGETAGYTTSNYDDGKEVSLNFPDEFAQAVKAAGFDLVSTANNHVLDKGVEGAVRTLDVLDKIGLDHTGSYRSASEKQNERIKLVECDGIKTAVLSYTYGSNYYDDSELIDGELSYITSIITGNEGEIFEKLKSEVEQDFKAAEKLDPDLIVVLPHIGTQFSNEPDSNQEAWFRIFKECGADIILGDHAHAVQPALIENYNDKNVFSAYCPGNFANIYRENQGDTSMLVDVYIDRDTKQVIGGSIVPLYTQSPVDGNYRALPIYEIENNDELRKQLSTDDYARAKNSNDIITKVVFGSEMDISSVTERYYFNETGFLRLKNEGLSLTEEMKSGTLYKSLEAADSICFIGDSLTEGTKNGGCPWYEPMEKYLFNKKILNYSKGGCTISYLNERADEIPEAELYVIAIGTNDVRYRDENQCAMTSDIYIDRIEELRRKLTEKNSYAEFVFIAPWYSTDGDPYCSLSYSAKTSLNDEYSEALKEYCRDENLGYINANPYLKEILKNNPNSKYLLDHIHPNAGAGIVMYSEAVLSY